MGRSCRRRCFRSRVLWTVGILLALLFTLLTPAGRICQRRNRRSAGVLSNVRDRLSLGSSPQFFPSLLAAPLDPASPQNPKLTTLLDDLARAVPQQRGAIPVGERVAPPPGFEIEVLPKSVRDAARGRMLRLNQNAEVQVYLHLAEVTDDHLRELRAAGAAIEITDAPRRIVQARVPATRLGAVADLPFVQLVRLPNYAVRHTGSVETEGDAIVLANQVRSHLGVDGTGVRVGVLSDGLKGVFANNCTTCGPATTTPSPMTTGDLPTSTGTRNSSSVLTASSGGITGKSFQSNHDLEGLPPRTNPPCGFPGAGAEGTALLEIIHDLAPKAQLYFANADTDLAFNQAVNYLAQNTDVAMDDLGFFGLPFDGTSDVSMNTAAALNNSSNPIRAYFTAVGNEANTHYLGAYADSGVDGTTIGLPAGHLHRFQATSNTSDVLGLGPRPYDLIELPTNGEVVVVLEWDDRFGASTNDYDLFLVEQSTGAVVARSTNRDCPFATPRDPVECFDYTYTASSPNPDSFHIVIQNPGNSAAVKNLNLFFFEPECAQHGPVTLAPTHERHNYNTPSRSVPAESDAGGSPVSVTSVGAICSASTTAATVFPSDSSCLDATHSTIEFFSSIGPTVDGRQKPDVSGIDGVSITGAGSFENPFFGSSAATPHAAGVAALLLQSAPCLLSGAPGARDDVTARTTLRNLILNNAVPLGSPVPNDVFGYGRLDALAAANRTLASAAGATNQTVSGNVPTGATLSAAQIGFSDPNMCPLSLNVVTGGCNAGSGGQINCPFGAHNVTLTASNNGVTMSPSASVTITVTNFAVSVSPATASVKAGQSATYTVSVQPQNGAFSNSIALACSNLPGLASCSFSPSSVTPGANTVTSMLTVSTTAASALVKPPAGHAPQLPLYALRLKLGGLALVGLGLLSVGGRKNRSRRFALALGLALSLVVAAVQASCGGGESQPPASNPGTPAGNYTITISGTSSSLVQSASAALTVN